MKRPAKNAIRPGGGMPAVRPLTRREFVSAALALGATAAAAGLPLTAVAGALPAGRPALTTLRLTDRLSQNPAFLARGTADGGLLLWVRRRAGAVTAFVLNRPGRRLFALCDGQRDADEICGAFATETGRTTADAAAFIDALLDRGLIVRGGHIRVPPGFPRPDDGGSYVHRS